MSISSDTHVGAAALQQALDALARYDRGSARGALHPLDEAVMAATRDPALARELEARLVAILQGPASAVAKIYACEKLALIGSADAVPALGKALRVAELTHAAVNALQALPGPEATAELRRALEHLEGAALIGVITALGERRDPASLPRLNALLKSPHPDVAAAAAAALGELGTPAAARALREHLRRTTRESLPTLADACLVCADRLRAAGEAASARELLSALVAASPPEHARAAALRTPP